MKKQIGVFACVLSLACSHAAFAAGLMGELHLIKGKVLVNKGKGYVSSGSAHAGDKIMVGSNSSAVLAFPGGCDVQLNAGQVYTVPAISPCALAQAAAPPPPPTFAPPPPVEPVFGSPMVLGAGVLGVAALGAAGYFLLTASKP